METMPPSRPADPDFFNSLLGPLWRGFLFGLIGRTLTPRLVILSRNPLRGRQVDENGRIPWN